MENGNRYKRFSLAARIQHFILAISVVLAIITGLPLKFADSFWVPNIVYFMGEESVRSRPHHFIPHPDIIWIVPDKQAIQPAVFKECTS